MSILVTRPSPAGEELVSRLRTLGQVAWHFPLIEFSPGRQLPQLADQLAALGESDLLFALSQHAVAFAQSQLHQQDRKWPRLPDYFAIGRTTNAACGERTQRPAAFITRYLCGDKSISVGDKSAK